MQIAFDNLLRRHHRFFALHKDGSVTFHETGLVFGVICNRQARKIVIASVLALLSSDASDRHVGEIVSDRVPSRYDYKAGVRIAFGTDAGVYRHGMNWLEFGYMIEAGMKPMDAIKSATTSAAELLGMKDQVGSIEAGKLADVVAVDGDPLKDPKVFGKVVFVMKNGDVYKQ